MARLINRQVLLSARPDGFPKETDFELVESSIPKPGRGQMLCQTVYLSIDPYMRGRMNAGASYAKGVDIGEVMEAGTVSRVIESNLKAYRPGDFVLGENGWQDFALSNGRLADGRPMRTLNTGHAPISTALGILGMPGHTAYVGLLDIGRPKRGETVVVSAASGAVGSAVGQIARMKGCRVVGIAGVQEKCDYAVDKLGFDACISHMSNTLGDDLRAACPDGIDVYFENVGGRVFDAVLPLLNEFSRVPVCGRIANYNQAGSSAGPDRVPTLMGLVLIRRITVRGFIVFDHRDREVDFLRDMGAWLEAGSVTYREDIVDGLEHAVTAFQGLLRGKNFGKLLIRVSPDSTRS